jgi:hypothetical protein
MSISIASKLAVAKTVMVVEDSVVGGGVENAKRRRNRSKGNGSDDRTRCGVLRGFSGAWLYEFFSNTRFWVWSRTRLWAYGLGWQTAS